MDQDVAFAPDIRPLFSDRDVRSMSSRFDLSTYVERFLTWIDNGFAP